MDHAKLLDILTSLPVSHAILPRAVCFARSSLANHAICSYIDSSGYASGPIRICLFIDYIIKSVNKFPIYFSTVNKLIKKFICVGLFMEKRRCVGETQMPPEPT